MAYKIRRASREDWRELKALRLAALRDPVAPVAFFESYERAARLGRRDWERRASGELDGTVTFVGEDEDGRWGGMLSVVTTPRCAEVISVYMLPQHRGTGLAAELMRTAIAWAGGREVRLRVHQNNPRAARFYASLGFRPTGGTNPDPRDPSQYAYELALRPD
ncbi:GNAT family N-acetyltransferase [Streptomyces sp. 6N223]|uniref:GNAT family N-acetyltransferase n=1 Tax=Streptomyces sp. 6N223 TaxID=3457412 RepID=UPI003FD3A70E